MTIPLGLKVAGGNAREVAGVDTSTTTGGNINISTSGTANVPYNWTEIVTSADFDANRLEFTISTSAIATGTALCFQVGIGASGSEVAITDYYKVGRIDTNAPYRVSLQVNIKKGDRVSLRGIGDTWDTITTRCHTLVNVENAHMLQNEILDTNTNYYDVITVDPGATANTKSAWVEAIASCNFNIKQLDFFVWQTVSKDPSVTYLIDIGIGASGSEVVIIPNYYIIGPAWSAAKYPTLTKFDVNIPAGTRIAIRLQSDYTAATGRPLDMTMNGWGN